ncbi:hypothetical protein KR026_011023 [Drosophila bipectinata]|nr:hypothetical protein KR026_011023 [Drosophila bipectinata]
MGFQILLGVLLLLVASKEGLSHKKDLCPVVTNNSPLCKGNTTHMCVCDFTCSGWDKPCNWVVSCQAQIQDINNIRRDKNKLIIFILPNRSYKQCLEINVNTHKHRNCCNLFCKNGTRDVCF